MPRSPAVGNFPSRVRDLKPFEVRIPCPRCGRVAILGPARLKQLDQRLTLTDLLARLECNETHDHRKCGGRPERLEIRYVPPGTPSTPEPGVRAFQMDRAGTWTEGEE